jgi:hypothetical protein
VIKHIVSVPKPVRVLHSHPWPILESWLGPRSNLSTDKSPVSVGTALAILWLGNTTSKKFWTFKCQDYSYAPCVNHYILSFVYNFNQNDILTSRMIPEVLQTRATKPLFHKNWGWNEKSGSGKSAQGKKKVFLVLRGVAPSVLDLRYLCLDCCCSYSSLNQALLEYDCTNPLNW